MQVLTCKEPRWLGVVGGAAQLNVRQQLNSVYKMKRVSRQIESQGNSGLSIPLRLTDTKWYYMNTEEYSC
jgi:hypothetical protein